MSWFPLCKALMEDNPEFSPMPSRYKVLFWMLISEYNLRGVFYRCDLEMAAGRRRPGIGADQLNGVHTEYRCLEGL